MTHLDELRLMELGLDVTALPHEAEAAHLRDCVTCGAALAEERALTGALERLPQPEVPAGFLLHARARFAAAVGARRRRVIAWGALAATVVLGVALASLVAGVGWDLPRVVTAAGWIVARGATLGRVAFVLLRTVPLLSTLLVAAMGASVLVGVTLLTQLTRVHVRSR